MKPKRTTQMAIFGILLVFLSACDSLATNGDDGVLEASGIIEAVEVAVAPEVNGRIAEIFVDKGDAVAIGDPLFRIEDDLLAAQRQQAVAALETAQANVALAQAAKETAAAALDPAHTAVTAAQANIATAQTAVAAAHADLQMAEAGVAGAETAYQMAVAAARQAALPGRVAAWNQDQPDEFETPPWYFQSSETLTAAEAEIAASEANLASEQANYAAVMAESRFEDLLAAEARLAEAQAAFLVVDELRSRAIAQNDDEPIDAYVQALFDTAVAELEAAQLSYNQLLSDQAAAEALEARARLAAAQERYEIALDRHNALLVGEDSLPVQAAAAALAQANAAVSAATAGVALAESNVTLAEIGVAQAEAAVGQIQAAIEQADVGVRQAETGLAQAEAALALLDLQMEKLVVDTAVAGIVLTRNVQPGELIQPGMTALTIGQLDALTVTVYIPENQYGQLDLGDEATVLVDSFPGERFTAVVTHIADQAEFTPRNVQTSEERQTTVYAVELAVTGAGTQLKPGMPADVRFALGG
ncbi:MAG: efflux RND transporter periplasmic adaptor subunit [Anaerolineales bacterium]|nr:efflux RND transporter periplasmic adaptor subunit [Anaerolineales bacterium]